MSDAPPTSSASGSPLTLGRDQAVLCPSLGAIIAEGGVPLDADGNFKLSDMHDYLVKSMNLSEGFAGLCIGLGPFSNSLRDVLGNLLAAHVNALDLRVGMAQHPGDSGVLRGGQFDEARFDALVSHSKNAVRENGKVVDGTMTVRDVAEAILANVRRDGSALAYSKGLPTSMFEFGSLLNILGKRDPVTGERYVSIRLMRSLYQDKKLPPLAELQARPPSTVVELTETMAQLAAAMPAEKPTGFAHHALTQAFHEVSNAIHTTVGLARGGRRPDAAAPATPAAPAEPTAPSTGVSPPPSTFVPPSSIEEVLADLNLIIDDALRGRSRIGYFAGLYESVTATIRRSVVAGVFDDNVRLARLDVIFATRFLEAWAVYRAGGTPTASYAVAFNALSSAQLLVVQHQLIALNAHIFLDLGIACATVAPGAALESLHGDFLKINTILTRFIGMIELKVAAISPDIKRIEELGMGVETNLINFSLRAARDEAWAFAQKLAAAPQADWPALIAAQDQRVAELGTLIRSPGGLVQPLLDIIAARESQDIAGNIIIVSE